MSESIEPVKKRVLVIANKNWEAAPLMDVLLEPKACPPGFPWPEVLHQLTSWQAGSAKKQKSDISRPRPRAVFKFEEVVKEAPDQNASVKCEISVEVWCLQDWMNPEVSSSSSSEKMKVLPKIFGWKADGKTALAADFVVAFGTAGFPTNVSSYNGSVVVGANAFIYNPFRDAPNDMSPWDDTKVERPIKPTLPLEFFDPKSPVIDDALRAQVEPRFIVPPMCPAQREILISAYNYTAVGVVNITNYDDFAWGDLAALKAFNEQDGKNPAGSIETTHGLIRIQSSAPFLFVSAITDREGFFNMEVGTRTYSQNFACAHNAGVVAAWLIPKIAHFVATRN